MESKIGKKTSQLSGLAFAVFKKSIITVFSGGSARMIAIADFEHPTAAIFLKINIAGFCYVFLNSPQSERSFILRIQQLMNFKIQKNPATRNLFSESCITVPVHILLSRGLAVSCPISSDFSCAEVIQMSVEKIKLI